VPEKLAWRQGFDTSIVVIFQERKVKIPFVPIADEG
jgi:hypothetical protein